MPRQKKTEKQMAKDKQIGLRLKEIRKYTKKTNSKKKVTQQDFANFLNVSIETYKKYESGERTVPDECITALSKELGINENYMKCKSDEFFPHDWSLFNDSVNVKDIRNNIKFFEYANYLGCDFEHFHKDFYEDAVSEFQESVNEFMKQKYQELKERMIDYGK